MKQPIRYLAVALAAGGLSLSCDEGRILTDLDTGPFETRIEALTGPDTLFARGQAQYSTTVRLGTEVLDDEVLSWSASPAGILSFDTAYHGTSLQVESRAPGVVTLTATVDHPDLLVDDQAISVTVLLLGVAPVAPASGDTTVTALGDELVIRARGVGRNGQTADSAGLDWDHRGSALEIVTSPLNEREALDAQAVAVGTDTLIFWQEHDLCDQGQCVDTIYIHVQPEAVRVEAQDTLRLATLGSAATPSITVYDRNDNVIPDPAVTWSLGDAADSVRIGLGADGLVTARANGTARVAASAGTGSDTVEVVVRQHIAAVTASPDLDLAALGASDTVSLAATDSGGAAVTRPFDVSWTSRNTDIATAETQADGRAAVTAVATGSTYVVGETESRTDSVQVTVTQAVDSVVITPAVDTINALGFTTTLAAQPVDSNLQNTDDPVSWTALDPGIATIDTDGLVTADAVGTARFTAAAGGVEDTATVLVRQVAGTVTISPDPVTDTLVGGDQVQLSAAAVDSGGSAIADPAVTWSAAPDTVATVDGTGLVTAQAVSSPDSAWVRAVSGPAADSVQVFVSAPVLTSVEVSPEQDTITALTDTAHLVARGLNQNGNAIPDETFSWQSRNTNVATVGASTGIVTAADTGQTYVVATSDTDPSLLDSALVVVEQVVDSVDIVPATHTFTAHSDTQLFTARAFDAKGQYIGAAAFQFADDLEGLVSLAAATDTTVEVTSQSNGTTEVYATESGTGSGLADTAAITVTQVADSIDVTPAVDTIRPGNTTQLAAEVLDANGATISGASVSWRVLLADTAIASVDSTGLVTGKTVGTAQIVANPSGTSIADTSFVTVTHYSLAFDGTDDYAEVGGDPLGLDGRATWTIELWVKPGANPGDVTLLGKGHAAGADTSYAVLLRDRRPVLLTHKSGGQPASRTSELDVGTALTQDAWSHVAFVYNSGTVELFVDGVSEGTGAMNEPQTSTASLFLGANSASAGFFDGQLDEVRFWSTARTGAQISGSKDQTLAVDTDMLAYWPMEEGTGDPVDLVASLTATLGAGAAAPLWSTDAPFNN